jgi:RNA polymerase sigma factor
MAAEAALDEQKLDQLITENEHFILRCTSLTARRYITKSDDEWSIALSAFAEAVRNYCFSKGSFLFFAETIIRRRLIDYRRNTNRHFLEIPVNPAAFSSDEEEEEEMYPVRKAVKELSAKDTEYPIKLEIEAANEAFGQYGFSFMDLSECSPKSEKTRSICAKTAAYILKSPVLTEEIRSSKQLPLKIVEKNLKIPRKKLERYRKYIIAAVEILSGEYPYLADYMHFIREEMGK